MVYGDSCHTSLAVLFLYIKYGAYSREFLKFVWIFIFFALWFQNVVTVNRRKTNRRKPRATCIECQW